MARIMVAEAVDGVDAFNKYSEISPDIEFLGIVMPNLKWIDALHKIMEMDLVAKVVMCSSTGQQSVITDAMEVGALDFTVKPFDTAKIMEVLGKLT